ncbi:hypothetical protein K493DRAFT_301053 [Basidiobolus meristosporus CBS 931.73]|uniref:G-protein coupled receptors family 3 profile domain-containing protein n=1 Tax=Basidiobolus meristosporus CBS 931.73 TaxID=1314790 RepID=A0A1Y1YES5_9FUNG|nr:hypothetical protein K493DRAFT_301053 [Basidiobolus meristosporus CBS 931.73]|eukprot:ORX96206.1 hypothetical protein K493DRAFT_301053 [Basidiobolus meristosporus CBS 931.73]
MNTTDAGTHQLNAGDMVTFDTTWYNTMNMAMLIFSATLIVHISNAYRAFRMYTKHPSNYLFIMNVVETCSGVSCHLCRVSDYFFVTDCHFKGYYNGVFYYISTALVMGIFVIRCYRVTPLRYVFLFIMVSFHITKLISALMYVFGLDAKVGTFRECVALPGGISMPFLLETEIYMNAVLFVWWIGVLVRLLSRKSYKFGSLIRDEGAGYTMLSNLFTITLMTMVVQNTTLGLNPEVLLQTKWAIESKLLIEDSASHSSQGSSRQENSRNRVHDIPFWSWNSSSKGIPGGSSKKGEEAQDLV